MPYSAESEPAAVESLSFLTDEAVELYERAKLVQEEPASRVTEDTDRNLYVLAILTCEHHLAQAQLMSCECVTHYLKHNLNEKFT